MWRAKVPSTIDQICPRVGIPDLLQEKARRDVKRIVRGNVRPCVQAPGRANLEWGGANVGARRTDSCVVVKNDACTQLPGRILLSASGSELKIFAKGLPTF